MAQKCPDRYEILVISPASTATSRVSDALRLSGPQQSVAHQEQVRQRAGHEQPVRILVEPPVADLGEAEHAFDHPEAVLDLGPHPRLGAVAGVRPVMPRPWCGRLML